MELLSIKKGYKLSEYGIFDRKTDKYIAGRTEKDVYKTLGLRLIPAEERVGGNEIKKAMI